MSACSGPPEVTPTATPSTSPSATANPGVEFRAIVDQTAIDPKAVGSPKIKGDTTTSLPQLPCNGALTTGVAAGHVWTYEATATISSTGTFAYHPELASAAVDGIRAELAKCTTTWKYGASFDMKPAGEFAVTRPDGFDGALAYCHEGTLLTGANKGTKTFICDAFLSRGHLMATVSALSLQKQKAQDEIKRVIPTVAAAIVKAQPTI